MNRQVHPKAPAARAGPVVENGVKDDDETAEAEDIEQQTEVSETDLRTLANDKRLQGKIRFVGIEEEKPKGMTELRDEARRKEMEV